MIWGKVYRCSLSHVAGDLDGADLILDETPILLWNDKVSPVEPGLYLGWGNTFYGPFVQESYYFLFHYQSLLRANISGKDPFESRLVRTKLYSVASFYCVQVPLRHIWQKFPENRMVYS